MTCIKIKNGIVCMANIEFICPKCKKVYSDSNDKHLNRCNNNKSGVTKIKCKCGQSFYMTYNYKGDAVSFLNNGDKFKMKNSFKVYNYHLTTKSIIFKKIDNLEGYFNDYNIYIDSIDFSDGYRGTIDYSGKRAALQVG